MKRERKKKIKRERRGKVIEEINFTFETGEMDGEKEESGRISEKR